MDIGFRFLLSKDQLDSWAEYEVARVLTSYEFLVFRRNGTPHPRHLSLYIPAGVLTDFKEGATVLASIQGHRVYIKQHS